MVASIAAGTTAQYYLVQTEYYLGAEEPDGCWLTAGPGLGVVAGSAVEREQFERLHAALDISGRSLIKNDGGRVGQVGGYDVTLSAPKSLSVLWGLADDELRAKLEGIQQTAAGAAVDLLNKQAAFCRRGHAGTALEKVSLTAAAFRHGEARPARHENGTVFADPQLHTHVVILNLAQRADGTFGRLDGRPLFAWKMTAGAVYHNALSSGLRGLGFDVELTGNNGIFEIGGVDERLRHYFSARREEIEEELAEIGLQTAQAPALAAAKARATRRSKAVDDTKDRHTFWRERSAAIGFDPDQVVERAFESGRASALDLARADEAADAVKSSEIVDAAARGLTDNSSTFERRNLVAAVAAALIEARSDRSVDDELKRLQTESVVIELGQDQWGHGIYSTPEIVTLEQELFDCAKRLAASKVAAPDSSRAKKLIRQAGLNDEQQQAALLACSEPGIVTIEGAPGVGKTTLLIPVACAWKNEGWRVIGTATAWKTANQLRDDLGIEAKAIDSWLVGADHGVPFLTDKTLVLIDEAGLVTSRQMSRILAEVEKARLQGHAVAVRLVGDRRQLQPIGGPGLRIVTEALGTQRVDTIVRQREQWARDVVTKFGNGEAAKGLQALDEHGCVHWSRGPAATVKAAVDAWDAERQASPNTSSLLIAKTNAQVLALNTEVRKRLRSAEKIAAKDAISVDAVTPSGTNYKLDLAKGDVVRFLCRNDNLGVINGTVGEIEHIETKPNQPAILRARIGQKRIAFRPDDLADDEARVQLAHAYGSTCYGAQGVTVDKAFVLADPAMDRHDIHVAASRARKATHLHVDEKLLDARVKSARLLSDLKRPVEPSERMAALATTLSRSGMTLSTLDYLQPAELALAHAELSPDKSAAVAKLVEDTADNLTAETRAIKEHGRRPARARRRSQGVSLE